MEKHVIRGKRSCPVDEDVKNDYSKKSKTEKDNDDSSKQADKLTTGHTSTPALDLARSKAGGEVAWREIRGENLKCDYCVLYGKSEADKLLAECEETLTYNTGQLARVNIFGKWHNIPRQQVAHGDAGLTYSFSNSTVPALPWNPLLERVRNHITSVTGYTFNFVLINRYKDGNDHIGEHRDDEKDLVSGYPIASLSLGQSRDFVFKHADARGKCAKRKIDPVKLELQHGSLLMMKHPTNTYWYHSLPPRKKLLNTRINDI